ncbi:MAG: dihydrolipoamide acetyltransferase family protein [Gaiellaceae bacterium]
MAHELKLPDLGEGLVEGEVSRWLVAEGETVVRGAPLVEIQTDKATVEIPAPVGGTVLMLLVREGELAPVGATLAVIGAEGEQLLRPVETPPQHDAGQHVPSEPGHIVAVVGPESLETARATPAVRTLARRTGVDLSRVQGTGPAGRITEADVQATASSGEGRREPIRGFRRAVVEQVERTHRAVPAVTFVEECDLGGIDPDRLVPLALHAVARSLREHPALNARVEADEIVYLERYDLGVALHAEAGTVVPVVRSCDSLTVDEIDGEVARLAAAARAGTLAPEDLRGSTFTVTCAGELGGILMTPLINHPEVAILGLHRVAPRPVVRDGEIVVREIGNVSVTFDHRVVDGLQAASFCLDVVARLQDRHRPPVQSR